MHDYKGLIFLWKELIFLCLLLLFVKIYVPISRIKSGINDSTINEKLRYLD